VVAGDGRICEHRFATADSPGVVVNRRSVQGDQAVLGWDLHLRRRGGAVVVRGISHLGVDADGRVVLHRDYWDPAEELYAHLPVIGALMRALRRKLSATG